MKNIKNFFKDNWLLIVAVFYLIWPLDIVPDAIPVAGQIDDVFVLALEMIRRWYTKKKNSNPN